MLELILFYIFGAITLVSARAQSPVATNAVAQRISHTDPSAYRLLSAVHGGPTHALALMERALAAQGVGVETATTDDDGPGRRNGKPTGQPLQEDGTIRCYFPKQFDFYKPSPAFAPRQSTIDQPAAAAELSTDVQARTFGRGRGPVLVRIVAMWLKMDRAGESLSVSTAQRRH